MTIRRRRGFQWHQPLCVLLTLAVCLAAWHIWAQFQAVDLSRAGRKQAENDRIHHAPEIPVASLSRVADDASAQDVAVISSVADGAPDVSVDHLEDAVSSSATEAPGDSPGDTPAIEEESQEGRDRTVKEEEEEEEEKSSDAQVAGEASGGGSSIAASGDAQANNLAHGQPEPSCAPPKNETAAQTLLRVYRQLCAWGSTGAGGVKRLAGVHRNHLASMYTPLIQMAPPAPLVGSRPTPLAANCKSQDLSAILTGKPRPGGPRIMVDVFTGMGGGPELDLLELRLHELDGVVDVFVVVESHFGNHGDRKPMHFNCQKQRYSAFLSRILHVRTDECPKYVKAAEKVQKDSKRGTGGVWNLQGLQRGCAVDALKARSPELPEDALVILSDLDELPSGRTMNILKHCEIKKDAKYPMFLKLKVVPFNLRTGCPVKRDLYTKGSVSSWKKFKEGKISVWPLPGKEVIPRGGVHLSSMGNLGQVSYKLLNHGESAQIASLVTPHDVDISTCDVKDVGVVRKLQQELAEKPISVMRHWERAKNLAKKPLAKAEDHMEELKNCELPWPLLTSPARYPFLWGDGSLDA